MEDLFSAASESDAKAGDGVETEYGSVMSGLSDAQRDAVTHVGGPLIVLAGPGTGKTRVITARVACMIRERGISPDQIAAVTFTNKAAGELQGRLADLVGDTVAARIKASTFHSLGLAIVRRFGDVLGIERNPELIDSAQRNRLIREIIREQHLYRMSLGSGISAAVEHAHNCMDQLRHLGMDSAAAGAWLDEARAGLGELEGDARTAREAELDRFGDAVEVYGHFESRCRDRGWLVFDDLILLPSRLIRDHGTIAAILRQEHRHVVVDEFQDVNRAQIEMIRALCPPERTPDVCVVGDDDQSIYGFRGADDRAFAHFAQIWSGARTVELTTNYRSAKIVVDASNATITRAVSRFAPDKQAVAHRGEVDASSVELLRMEDDGQSGEAIASMLLAMASAGGEDFRFKDCAVIARTTSFLEQIARTLLLEGIPIDMREKHAPMEDDGVRDVFAWMRWLVDPESSNDLRRILSRPPYHCDGVKLGSLISGYRAARSRFEQAGDAAPEAGEDREADPGALLDWVLGRGDEETRAKIGPMRALGAELASVASERNAAEAVLEIIKRTGVVHRELGDSRQRAQRIESLAAVVRFARSRLSRFDAPGDLGAMLAYFDDLDENDQSLGELPEEVVAHSGATATVGSDGDRGAVALLTAHSSKGLEFDTVFIPRVGQFGYPQANRGEKGELPAGVVDRTGDERDEKSRHSDEERRVFFVALTRAERRAVVMAKLPKKPSSANYALELRDALGGGLIERDVDEVIDPQRASDAVSRLSAEFKAVMRVRDVFDQAKRDARRDAARAIDAHELDEIDRGLMLERVGQAADRAAVVSEVLRTGVMPDWVADEPTRAFAMRLLEALEHEDVPKSEHSIYPGLRGPLKLSFSQISKYLHCPRCYLAEYVLKLPADDGLQASLGTAVHEGLEQFYTRWRDADAEGRETPGFEVLERITHKRLLHHWPRDRVVDPDRVEQLGAMLRVYWEQMHDEHAHIEELEKPIRLSYVCDGMTHTLSGKIDRVDASESGGRRVIDYKTGFPRKELIEPKNVDLQLGIYAMALQEELGDPGPGSVCEYWCLQDGSRGVIGFDALKMGKIHEQIDKVIRGILAGEWGRGRNCTADDASCMMLDVYETERRVFSDTDIG